MTQDKSHELGLAMTKAIVNNDFARMEELAAQGADIEYNTKGCNLPLFNAAYRGHTRIVAWLISKGADVCLFNHNPNDVDAPPLVGAAFSGHREIVEMLLAAGADPCAVSSGNKTAAEYAQGNNHHELAAYLRSQQYAVDICNRWKVGERSVEEHFNFIKRERMTLIMKPDNSAVETALREGFDAIEESVLRKAFDEHVRRGGHVDEGSVFVGKVVKSVKPCFGLG